MGTMTKWPVQKHTKHHKTQSKQGSNRHKEITIFLCFSIFLIFIFNFQLLKGILQKMLNYRLGTVNEYSLISMTSYDDFLTKIESVVKYD